MKETQTMKKLMMFVVAFTFLGSMESLGQPPAYGLNLESQDDPGYKLYREGYNLVLEANWKEASRKFDELLRTYPKSLYRDDAGYWKAYSLKYVDEKKAVESLKTFLKEFPRSSYRGDALQDLAELQARIQGRVVVFGDSIRPGRIRVEVPDLDVDIPDVQVFQNWDADFPFGDRVAVRVFSDEIRDNIEWGYGYAFSTGRAMDLDENTRLKISALRGVAAERDSESYRTVRDILLDRKENARLREEALRLISRYQKFDILPSLKDIAQNDPDQRLRHGAIYYIARYGKDKDRAAGTLIDLYFASPKDSLRFRERLLSSIASTRANKGMDFLINVVKSDENSQLRESALYWLGRYGEGKKKQALYEILKRK
jgi:muconolactone delta-isomerase